MFKMFLTVFFLWILHSRAHLESETNIFVNIPEPVTSDDTPVNHGEISGGEVAAGERPWRKPDFSQQKSALGYKEEAFRVPKGLEKAVGFWVDIYTKYNTRQGVIHDSENIDLVYEVVDFSAVEKMTDLSPYAKEKMKKKLVNEAKERASEILKKLDHTTDVAGLSPQEKRVWDYFKNVDNPKKFREANTKDRLRFQLGQSDRMKQAIFFSGRYMEEFEQIFREEKLPLELTRLVFVESSFNVLARSKVGASGLWQLMPSVARPHRMINQFVDRRNDPWDATHLAAKVLASNYRMLEHWPLAITGYNHGPNGVRRIVDKNKTTNIVELIDNVRYKKTFGFASRNFYASFLAALEVEKNAGTYFPGIKWSEKLKYVPYKTTTVLPYKELVKLFEDDPRQAEIFNPHLTFRVKAKGAKIPAGTKIYIPSDKLAAIKKTGSDRRLAAEDPTKKY